MLTHSAICDLVAASYNVPATWQAGNDVRAVGTQVGDEFVVAIPGTTDLQGWLDDFSIAPKLFPIIGSYHEGFGIWGLRLAAMVLPKLPTSGRIVIAGHSLGGQLALVMAAAYAAQKLPRARVITFGCPRGAFMGNITAGPLVRSALEVVEYRNYGDPVPDVPPWMWKHAKMGTMIGDPAQALHPSPLDIITKDGDHAITLYQANVKAAELLKGRVAA